MVNSFKFKQSRFIFLLKVQIESRSFLIKIQFLFFYFLCKFFGDIWDDKIIIFEINKTLVEKLPETEHK